MSDSKIIPPRTISARASKLLARAPAGSAVLYLDTETTGLSSAYDELLEIAIVDEAGTALIDTLVRPTRHKTWRAAQAIHNISPDDVATAPPLDEISDQLLDVLTAADAVVIYNAPFDLGFLPDPIEKVAEKKAVCAMRTYSAFMRTSQRWHLADAARVAGHVWTGRNHRALSDALALRTVWQWMRAGGV